MKNFRRDLPASLVVFLIALPLSLGIALASGAPIVAGLIGAIAGGVVTGWLAGSPLQVSGPEAGLTVVVAGLVQQFGWETMCLITACAGVVQLLLGFFKVARGALIISPAVVHGMLAGIGISIALAQLHVVLGTAVSLLVKMDVKRVDLPETFEFTRLAMPSHWGPFAIAVLTVAIIASIESLLCAVFRDKVLS